MHWDWNGRIRGTAVLLAALGLAAAGAVAQESDPAPSLEQLLKLPSGAGSTADMSRMS